MLTDKYLDDTPESQESVDVCKKLETEIRQLAAQRNATHTNIEIKSLRAELAAAKLQIDNLESTNDTWIRDCQSLNTQLADANRRIEKAAKILRRIAFNGDVRRALEALGNEEQE